MLGVSHGQQQRSHLSLYRPRKYFAVVFMMVISALPEKQKDRAAPLALLSESQGCPGTSLHCSQRAPGNIPGPERSSIQKHSHTARGCWGRLAWQLESGCALGWVGEAGALSVGRTVMRCEMSPWVCCESVWDPRAKWHVVLLGKMC